MSSKLVFFRADGSSTLGAGHLHRAFALAQNFKAANYSVHVFSKIFDSNFLISFQKKFSEHNIPLSTFKDEVEFIGLLRTQIPKILFLDLRENPDYLTLIPLLGTLKLKTVCMDDFFPNLFSADWIIKPYFQEIPDTHSNVLTGLKYFVFSDELAQFANKTTAPKNFPPQKILVTMGGSDPMNATPKILEALCPAFPQMHFTAVIGPGFKSDVKNNFLGKNISIVSGLSQLGDHYINADFAITSGGLTKYETALFGLPSLIMGQNAQEEELGKEFSKLNTSFYFGSANKIEAEKLLATFTKIINDATWLQSAAKNGRNIIDTFGGRRIIEHLEKTLP